MNAVLERETMTENSSDLSTSHASNNQPIPPDSPVRVTQDHSDDEENERAQNKAPEEENLALPNLKNLSKTLHLSSNITSTPLDQEKRSFRLKKLFREGFYESRAMHKDGSTIGMCRCLIYLQKLGH